MGTAPNHYLHRSLERPLRRALQSFAAVTLTGPRQSGKTTLLRTLLGSTHRYFAFDLADIRAAALSDPRAFLAQAPPPVILDEIQEAPGLLPYLRAAIDENRDAPGRFVLTGSQNLAVAESVGETLAGRSAVLQLHPLTGRELDREPERPFPWDEPGPAVANAPPFGWLRLIQGGYPEIARRPGIDISTWYGSYVQTYLERDVRSLRQVGDLLLFQMFLRALAHRAGQLLNLTTVARDLGIAVNTARAWLSVLETSFVVFRLLPWFENTGKRLVKTPKLYFYDTGLLCHLVGLTEPRHAAQGPMSGALIENHVVSEVYRSLLHRGERTDLYFWRTSDGYEIDLVLDRYAAPIPIEVKATATPHPSMASGLRLFRQLVPRAAPGWLLHTGSHVLPIGDGVTAFPITRL